MKPIRFENDNRTIRIYLEEIGQIPLLTIKEEISLSRRIRKGDDAARQIMIQANLRLVVKIANTYVSTGMPLLDLIAEGNIGLMKAVDRYDPRKGGKVSTYAAWWIRQGIRRALANKSRTIRIPTHILERISKMRKADRALMEEFGREPTVEDIAARLRVNPDTVRQWQVLVQNPMSLNAPVDGDNEAEIGDIIGDDNARAPYENLNHEQIHDEIETLLDTLDERTREVICCRFGLEGNKAQTLEEVGARFKITRERVRQIQRTGLTRLREMIRQRDRQTVTRFDRAQNWMSH
jgi:RNA polymerase primary sigma factor